MIFFGIFCIINSNSYKEDRNEVIIGVSSGILIISATIINYIFYIKRNLKDFNQEAREKIKKANIKIGEIIQIIFFTLFVFTPIWRIPKFIELFDNRFELIKQIILSFLLSISSIILLITLNPIDIKGKLAKFKNLFDRTNKKL